MSPDVQATGYYSKICYYLTVFAHRL